MFGLLGWTRLGLGLALDWLKSMWLQLGPSSSSPATSAQPNGAINKGVYWEKRKGRQHW